MRLIAATKLAKAALSHRVYTSGNKSVRQSINESVIWSAILNKKTSSHSPSYEITASPTELVLQVVHTELKEIVIAEVRNAFE